MSLLTAHMLRSEIPWLVPHCASCSDVVEKWTIHELTDPDMVEVEAICHGKTEGTYLRDADLAAVLGGEPFVMFKGRFHVLGPDVIVAR